MGQEKEKRGTEEVVFCEKSVNYFDKKKEKKDTFGDLKDAKQGIKDTLPTFQKVIYNLRKGYRDEQGIEHKPKDISADEAVKTFYGAESLQDFLKVLGVSPSDQMNDVTAKLYGTNNMRFTNDQMFDLLEKHSKLNFAAGTGDYGDYSFFLPELILGFVRNGYNGGGLHRRWISGTQDTNGSTSYIIPHIVRGAGFAKAVAEGAQIPITSMKLGSKRNNIEKIGTGTEITDELFGEVSLMSMGDAMADFGQIIAMGEDAKALKVLINGDKADLSESAPLIGVANTANGIQLEDLMTLFATTKQLMHNYNYVIVGTATGIKLYTIPALLGFGGETKLARLNLNLAIPASIDGDVFDVVPAGKAIFLDTTRAMRKVTNGGVIIERDREAARQVTRVYGTAQSDFAILRRDARAILDSTTTNITNPYPAYMDISAYLSKAAAGV